MVVFIVINLEAQDGSKHIPWKLDGASERIEKVRSYEINTLEISQSKKTEPRIHFGWLIERKLI